MTTAVYPRRNLPDEAVAWGRAVETRQVSTEQETVQLRQMVENLQRAFAGLSSVTGTYFIGNIDDPMARLRGRVLYVHESSVELPDSRANGYVFVATGYNLSVPAGGGVLFGHDIQYEGGPGGVFLGRNMRFSGNGGIAVSDRIDEGYPASSFIIVGSIIEEDRGELPSSRSLIIGDHIASDQDGSGTNINIGRWNVARGGATVFGRDNTGEGLSGDTLIVGVRNEMLPFSGGDTVFGRDNTIAGGNCFVAGGGNTVSAGGSAIVGRDNQVGQVNSLFGQGNVYTNSGGDDVFGSYNTGDGVGGNVLVGTSNTLEEVYVATIVGRDNEVQGAAGSVFGQDNSVDIPISYLLGAVNTVTGSGSSGTSSVVGRSHTVDVGLSAAIFGHSTDSIVEGDVVSLGAGGSFVSRGSVVSVGANQTVEESEDVDDGFAFLFGESSTVSAPEGSSVSMSLGTANEITHSNATAIGHHINSTADDQVAFGDVHIELDSAGLVDAPGAGSSRTFYNGEQLETLTDEYRFIHSSPVSENVDLTWTGSETLALTPNLHQIYAVTLTGNTTLTVPEAPDGLSFEILLDVDPDTYTLDFDPLSNVVVRGGSLSLTERTVVRLMCNSRGWFAYV